MKKKGRLSTVFIFIFALAAGAVLFRTAQGVQKAEADLRRAQQAASQEEQTIRVLRAEWDYLNRPSRLEALATQELGLTRPEPQALKGDLATLSVEEMPEEGQDQDKNRKLMPIAAPVAVPLPSSPPSALPRPKPIPPESPNPGQNFQSLLNTLTVEEGEGAP